jgi:uncharacterized protein (TIGR02466 family)
MQTGQILNWFPTTLYQTNDASYIPELEKYFNTIDWPAHSNNTTYFDDCSVDIPGFKDFICTAVNTFASMQGVRLDRYTAHIDKIWLNSMPYGAGHARHAHGYSHYSGTFYVNNPEGAANIRFYNPSADLIKLALPPVDDVDLTQFTAEWAEIEPVLGNLLVWNSWLYHEVLENKSTAVNRNTVSFNVRMLENAR